jgi:hypothetical protein
MINEGKKSRYAVATLLMLAPFLGELVSGSSPPKEYFQPITFLLLTTLYGTGALIVRETARRWSKGWISILFLGMAYGIFEEGIMVRSFFDQGWQDLGQLAVYGRWIGINWIWSIALTIFHAVVSISIPIAITELLFPGVRESKWLSKKQLFVIMVIFLANAFIGPLFGMRITAAGMLANILSIVGLIFLAYRWPMRKNSDAPANKVKNWRIIFAGFLMMIGLIIGMWVLPSLHIPWLITFIFLCGLPWLGIRWFDRLGVNQWTDSGVWSCIIGLLLPWLVIDVISEMDNSRRPDDTSGMIISAILCFIFLVILRIVIKKKEKESEFE